MQFHLRRPAALRVCAAYGRYASLCQFNGSFHRVTPHFQPAFKQFKQRNGIRSNARKARDDFIVVQTADFTLPFITVLPSGPDHHRRLPHGRYGVRLLLLSRADPLGYNACTGLAQCTGRNASIDGDFGVSTPVESRMQFQVTSNLQAADGVVGILCLDRPMTTRFQPLLVVIRKVKAFKAPAAARTVSACLKRL